MNDPPRLTVEDKSGQTSIAQWDLDPGLSKFTLAREQLLNWIDSTGQAFEAGLYLPIGFRQGERYPLVVQTHGFNAKRFWVMGPYSGTAFAAQPLANAGFMVVQLDEDDSDVGSFQELNREVDRITSVISELSRRGLVDGMKVGIIGFSRTCLFTKAVLANAGIPVAAASVADGVDDGYFQYLLQNSLAFQSLSETAIGGIPFGEGLSHWEARSPGFNMNRVKTPLLIEALNAYSALFQWEWFAGLRRLDKPVEMMMLQDGTHILRKPWDRIASAQANVDWFRFWLQGYEDPNPAKVEQYRRWEKLCDMQLMEIPKQPVFCVGTRH
jgi:dipeptidyl aminopeptidase/acylaminoacyl peptidase